MQHIQDDEIKYINERRVDELGEVFLYKERIFRGIYPDSVNLVYDFIESGFLGELQDKNLFPKTWISELTNKRYGLILEHERINPIIYPQEWSFSMLKEAALMVLDVAIVALDYGYNMIDCHKMNVLYKDNKPYYVDLGSFYQNEAGATGWGAFFNFNVTYYYLLQLWTRGLHNVAKEMSFPQVIFIELEFLLFKYWFLRKISLKRLQSLIKFKHSIIYAANIGYERINIKTNGKRKLYRIAINSIKKIVNSLKPSPSQNIPKLKAKVQKIHIKKHKNKRYFDASLLHYKTEVSIKVNKIVNDFILNDKSVFVISGNNSELLNAVLENKKLSNLYLATWSNTIADNYFYQFNNKETNFPVSVLSYNIFAPKIRKGLKSPEIRFQTDVIMISDIIEVLNSSQGLNFNIIFKIAKEYSREYLLFGLKSNKFLDDNFLRESLKNNFRKFDIKPLTNDLYLVIAYN